MEQITLEARTRHELGRHARALRRTGGVPAILYGPGLEPVPLVADAKSLDRVWQRAGRTHLIDLRVDGARPRKVLIRQLQVNPRSATAVHVDLFAPNLRQRMDADIPIVVIGEPRAVGEGTGQLLQTLTSVRIQALPGDLPPQLSVDVSELAAVDDSITLADIELPKGVTLAHADPGDVVVKIVPQRVREEEPAEAPAAAAEAPAPEEAEPAAEGGE